MAGRSVKVSFTADNSALKRGVKESEDALGRLKHTAEGSFEHLRKVAEVAGGVAGIGAIGIGIEKTVEAAKEGEVAQAKLGKAVDNAGISWKKHREEIEKTLDKQSLLSGFTKGELSDALANMVRTTGSVSKALTLNHMAMDVARTKGMNLASAQSLLARVYNGSYTGLKKLGIAVEPVTTAQDKLKASTQHATAEQIAHAKALDKTATANAALATVQKKFSGQTEAYAHTAAGSMDRARAAINLAQEDIGKVFLPIIAKVAGAMANAAQVVQAKWPEIKTTLHGVFTIVKADVEAVVGWFEKHRTATHALAAGVGVLVTGLTAYKVVTLTVAAATKAWTIAQGALNLVMDANPVTLVIVAIAALAAGIVVAYEKCKTFRTIVNTAFNDIKAVASAVFPYIKKLVENAVNGAVTVFKGMVQSLKGVINVIKGVLNGNFSQIWTGVKQIFSGGIKEAVGVIKLATTPFRTAFSALFNGMKGLVSGLFDGVVNVFVDSINAVLKVLNKAIDAYNAIPLAPNVGHVGLLGHTGGGGGGSSAPAQRHGGVAMAGGGRVPGTYVPADSVPAMLSPGETVFTFDGQSIINTVGAMAGIPNLVDMALSSQRPHFRDGGRVQRFMSGGRVARLAREVGFSGNSLIDALAISDAESRFDEHASNRNTDGSIDRGLWQINSVHGALSTFNPLANAVAAWKISRHGKDWSPWSTFKNHAYRKFLGVARSLASGSAGTAAKGKYYTYDTPLEHFDAYDQGYQSGAAGNEYSGVYGRISKAFDPKAHKVTAPTFTSSSGSPLSGTKGLPAAVTAMLRFGSAAAKRHYPYAYGGGHDSHFSGPYDCSGGVSAILHAGGYLKAPMSTDGLKTFGAPGNGKWVTIGVRGTTGRSAHTMVKVGNTYFESGGAGGKGLHVAGGWDGSFPIKRHPVGLRTGGRIAFGAGGRVQDYTNPNSPLFRGWGLRKGGRVPSIINQIAKAAPAQVKPLLGTLNRGMPKTATDTLFAEKSALEKLLKHATGQHGRAVRGALDIVEGELGRRVGSAAGAVDQTTGTDIPRSDRRFADQMRIDGIDPNSVEGLKQVLGHDQGDLDTLKKSRTQLLSALKIAKRTHNKPLIKKIRDAINNLDDQIYDKRADVADDQRAVDDAGNPANDPTAQALQQVATLLQTLTDNQTKILAVGQQQASMFPSLVAAIANGQIGGQVGLGFQSVGYAGGVARY